LVYYVHFVRIYILVYGKKIGTKEIDLQLRFKQGLLVQVAVSRNSRY